MPNVMYIAKALEGRKEGKDWRCLCPVHDGHHFIITDKRGTFQMHCLMGAKQDELQRALESRGLWELSVNGNHPSTPRSRPQTKKLVAEYFYRDTDGEAVAVKGRFETDTGKTFLWRTPDDRDWGGLAEGQGKTLPLYGAELLPVNGEIIWFVEGEKAADACRDYGLTAVCGYSGASVPERDVLAVLEGQRVVIWPDNDEPGRLFAVKLKAALDGIADVQILPSVSVPERGDAFDYFKFGGTTERLMDALAAAPTEPRVETTDRGFLVTLPELGGAVRFQFDDPSHGRHRLDVDLSVWIEAARHSRETFTERLNLLSGSNRTELRRALEDFFPDMGKGFWTRCINRAVSLCQNAIRDHDPSIRIADAPDRRNDGYIVTPLLLEAGPTIWFGDGGTGKSYQALMLAKEVCEGGRYIGHNCAERAVIYIDYETDASTVKKRLKEIGGYPDNFYYWPGRGVPLYEMVPALQRKIQRDIVGLVVIDSAVPACGGEPEKADTARAYFSALAQLGNVATLTISHVTKAGEDHYPFGSIMWNNLARLTWNVKSASEEGDTVQHLALYNRKVNDDRLHRPIGLQMSFVGGTVTVEREEIRHEDLTKHLSLIQRVRRALGSGAKSTRELAEELDVTDANIRKQCRRLAQKGEVQTMGRAGDGSNLWGLAA